MAGEHLLPTLLGLVLALFGPPAIAAGTKDKETGPPSLGKALVGQFALLALSAGVLLMVLLVENRPLSSIGLFPPRGQTFALGIALTLFFIFIFSPIAFRMLSRFQLGGFDQGLSKLAGLPVWYLILAVVIGGSVEELLYRGYAVERLAELTGSYWLGGLISVAVFGLAHVPGWGWGPALTTVVSGGIATAVYIWQQDLLALVLAHVTTDFVGIVVTPRFAKSPPA